MSQHLPGNLRPRVPVTQPADLSYRIIPLTQDQITLVDASDYEWLNQWNWHAWWNKNGRCFYAVRSIIEPNGKKGTVYMHREIMGSPAGMHIDHWDQDSLNNRRYNLRIATSSQNSCNRGAQIDNKSGFKGVRWHKRDQCWTAAIKINKKYKHLGTFPTAEVAAEAYRKAALELHGEFAAWGNHKPAREEISVPDIIVSMEL